MNRQAILDSWAAGQLFGISEQFTRAEIELSGISGWFALVPGQCSGASGHGPRGPGAPPRHATGQLSHATGHPSRRPGELSRRPSQSAGLTAQSAGRPGALAGLTGQSAGRPGDPSRRPGRPDGRPTEPDGRPGGPEGRGDGARRPGGRAVARRLFAPTGRRDLATGGASRSDAEPVDRTCGRFSCPGGAEGIGRTARGGKSSAPAGAGFIHRPPSTGCVGEAPTPPVATGRDPFGVEDRMHAFSGEVPEAPPAARPSGISGGARAGDGPFRAGEVPEGRHAPLASADQHARGEVVGVLHGA